MIDLRITSYNCRSVKNSITDVYSMCDRNDIVFLQEHWIPMQDLSFFNSFHADFVAYSSSPVDLSAELLLGRPYGGIAVLVRRSMEGNVKLLNCDDTRFMVLEFIDNEKRFALINTYLPHYDNGRNLEEYINVLAKINTIITEYGFNDCIFMGDMNCHIGTRLYHELLEFCNDNQLSIVDVNRLPADSFTYISDMDGSHRWLDHVVCSYSITHAIKSIKILNEYFISDHRALQIILNIDLVHSISPSLHVNYDIVTWSNLAKETLDIYKNLTKNSFTFQIPNCIKYLTASNKKEALDEANYFYDQIISCLVESGIVIAKKTKPKYKKYKQIAGWNEYIKDLYRDARQYYKQWRMIGSPRSGYEHTLMHKSRLIFKNSLKFCRENEAKIINDKIAELHLSKDTKRFWSEINKHNNKRCNLPNNIDGITGDTLIAHHWRDYFKNILTGVDRNAKPDEEILDYDNDMIVDISEVSRAIKFLSRGKSEGPDGVSAEHLMFADKSLYVYLSLLFTFMFRYSIVPEKFMYVHITPIIKNKGGILSSRDNYRPIALSSIVSKVFEQIILNRINNYLYVNDNQFAFKKDLSTELCVYVLKQIIADYKENNTPLFVCFIDIRKAFDRVNNDKLLSILECRHIPYFIIEILKFWFINQKFFIKWKNVLSFSFRPTCGLRQGSKLSPLLFNLYINKLSEKLNNSNPGTYMNFMKINHLCYADDTALLAPSTKGLQELINICHAYGEEYDVLFNVEKTKCMVFTPKKYDSFDPVVTLYGKNIEFVKQFKYLGIILSENDEIEIRSQYRQLCARSNTLIRKFNKCSDTVKISLFKTYCTSIYGITLWSVYRNKILNNIRICYNNSFRFLMNYHKYCSASFMFVYNNVKSFSELLRQHQWNFIIAIDKSKNTLIKACSSLAYRNSSVWMNWKDSLY